MKRYEMEASRANPLPVPRSPTTSMVGTATPPRSSAVQGSWAETDGARTRIAPVRATRIGDFMLCVLNREVRPSRAPAAPGP